MSQHRSRVLALYRALLREAKLMPTGAAELTLLHVFPHLSLTRPPSNALPILHPPSHPYAENRTQHIQRKARHDFKQHKAEADAEAVEFQVRWRSLRLMMWCGCCLCGRLHERRALVGGGCRITLWHRHSPAMAPPTVEFSCGCGALTRLHTYTHNPRSGLQRRSLTM